MFPNLQNKRNRVCFPPEMQMHSRYCLAIGSQVSSDNQIPVNQSAGNVSHGYRLKPRDHHPLTLFPPYKWRKLKLSGQFVKLTWEIRSLNFWSLDLFTGENKSWKSQATKLSGYERQHLTPGLWNAKPHVPSALLTKASKQANNKPTQPPPTTTETKSEQNPFYHLFLLLSPVDYKRLPFLYRQVLKGCCANIGR